MFTHPFEEDWREQLISQLPFRLRLLSACVLIRSERGKFETVTARLAQLPQVMRAFSVLGRFDIVADVEARDSLELGRAILKINRLAGVVFTETLPQVEGR
ncbi:MAG: Lrp/AsnC family transcriptional regulator [Thaumarchaeota archaeon]|nr:MAG: Lrp/AsnC family transcriptional regulator [Nitrososphaerota archaeon]